MATLEIERLVRLLARLPGLGPRSARRAALAMLKRRERRCCRWRTRWSSAPPRVEPCSVCGNLDSVLALLGLPRSGSGSRACCASSRRVEDCGPMERAWHLRRPLSCAGRDAARRWTASGPRSWASTACWQRVQEQGIGEVILALGATVDGQTTGHYLAERLKPLWLHRQPSRPWRAGRRRAHLPGRRDPRRRVARRRSGSLDRPAPTPYLTATFHDLGRAQASWRCSRSCRPRIRC